MMIMIRICTERGRIFIIIIIVYNICILYLYRSWCVMHNNMSHTRVHEYYIIIILIIIIVFGLLISAFTSCKWFILVKGDGGNVNYAVASVSSSLYYNIVKLSEIIWNCT